jgi:type I restriction enzyme, S subunit
MRERWVETTLGQVAEFHNGYPFKPSELTGRGHPVVRIKQLLDADAPVDHSDTVVGIRQQIDNGDLIFSWSGTLASRIWDRGPALLNQHLFRVMERPGVLRGWLHLALDHAVDGLMEKAHGTTMKHVTKKVLEAHLALLPPEVEQRRIADLVGALDGQIVLIAQEYVAAGRACEAVRGELMRPRPNWVETTLDAVAEIFDGPHATPVKTEEGPRYLSISSLRQGEVDLSYSAHLSEQDLLTWTRRVAPQRGDTLFSYETRLGEAGYWDSDADAALGRRMGLLRPRPDRLLPQLLTHLYLAPAFQALIEDRAVRGSTVDRIPIALIGSWPISVPDVDEQRRIVGTLTTLDKVVRALRDELASLRKARTALLGDLLNGSVAIPDSYDLLLEAV